MTKNYLHILTVKHLLILMKVEMKSYSLQMLKTTLVSTSVDPEIIDVVITKNIGGCFKNCSN